MCGREEVAGERLLWRKKVSGVEEAGEYVGLKRAVFARWEGTTP